VIISPVGSIFEKFAVSRNYSGLSITDRTSPTHNARLRESNAPSFSPNKTATVVAARVRLTPSAHVTLRDVRAQVIWLASASSILSFGEAALVIARAAIKMISEKPLQGNLPGAVAELPQASESTPLFRTRCRRFSSSAPFDLAMAMVATAWPRRLVGVSPWDIGRWMPSANATLATGMLLSATNHRENNEGCARYAGCAFRRYQHEKQSDLMPDIKRRAVA
jgi:hypothetical protein